MDTEPYSDSYDRFLAKWPVPFESRMLAGDFGHTHVLVCGPADASPVVLLHGYYTTSLAWYANIAALSAAHRVFLIDTITDAGRSRATRPLRGKAAYARWLTELMAQLGMRQAGFGGMSLGAYLAVNLALHAPQLVSRLLLAAPATVFAIPPAMMLLRVLRANFRRNEASLRDLLPRLTAPGFKPDPDFARLVVAGRQHFVNYPGMVPLPFSTSTLQQLQQPVLVVAGQQEVFFRPEVVLRRAERVLPNADTLAVPDAGHFVCAERPDVVNPRISAFFAATNTHH